MSEDGEGSDWKPLPPRRIRLRHEKMTARAQAWVAQNLGGLFERSCTVCGYAGLFAPFRNLIDERCPGCNSRPHHRLFALWLREETPIRPDHRLLHFAPEWGLKPVLRSLTPHYTTTHPYNRGHLILDIEAMDLPEESFDVAICHQVIEHVDDRKALAELFRILTPGGFAVLTTPVCEGWDETYENPEAVSRRDRILHFGQGDHTRYYGRDFRDRIRAAGFALTEFTAVEPHVSAHALERGGKLFIATKPG